MDLNLTDIKDIASFAKPLIDPIISTLISPKIKALEKWIKKKHTTDEVVDNFYEDKFREYLNRTYEKLSALNILVFPNQQINIKSIYQPLTIVSSNQNKRIRIQTFHKEYIEPYKKILISDTAGMGKSTLLKWIGLSLIEQQISIPILIELKRLNEKHSVLDEINKQIDPIDKSFNKDLLLKFIELGQFSILLDGFDEIQYELRQNVITDLRDFCSKASLNWFILASRPDSSLTSFGDFQLFNIKPLEISESFELIKKYDALNTNKVSEQLITNIQTKHPQVNEFLVNPFLVSLLYKTYTYNKDIPSKKSTFYEEVYSALYKHHDLSKDGFKRNKKSGLDLQDFRLILRQLAFDTSKVVKVEFNEQELVRYVKEAKIKCIGLSFKEQDFIEDIELNVPLFVRDGIVLKWAHKSFQDYFSADFISSSKEKERIIDLVYKSGKENYLNILDFLYELEYKTFRKIIIKDILEKFIKYCENSYSKFSGFKKSIIKDRQALTFTASAGFYVSDSIDDFDEASAKFFKSTGNLTKPNIISRTKRGRKFFFTFFSTDFKQEIFNLLRLRSEPIFKYKSFLKPVNWNRFESIPTETPLYLNEKIGNIVNSKNNFDLFTKITIKEGSAPLTNGKFFLPDYILSKKYLTVLLKEDELDNDKDLLKGI